MFMSFQTSAGIGNLKISSFQIGQGRWIVLQDRPYRGTAFQICAIAAGRHAFFQCALTDRAQLIAEDRFDAIDAAALAMNMLRKDRRLI